MQRLDGRPLSPADLPRAETISFLLRVTVRTHGYQGLVALTLKNYWRLSDAKIIRVFFGGYMLQENFWKL